MRVKINKYRFIILLVVLITGVSITGWAITFHFNKTAKIDESWKASKNGGQSENIVSASNNHNNTILLLVSTGLIGFIGIRRPGKRADNPIKIKSSERRNSENFVKINNRARQQPVDGSA